MTRSTSSPGPTLAADGAPRAARLDSTPCSCRRSPRATSTGPRSTRPARHRHRRRLLRARARGLAQGDPLGDDARASTSSAAPAWARCAPPSSHAFGMVGVGAIFEAFRDGGLEDDDEVAVAHGAGGRRLPAALARRWSTSAPRWRPRPRPAWSRIGAARRRWCGSPRASSTRTAPTPWSCAWPRPRASSTQAGWRPSPAWLPGGRRTRSGTTPWPCSASWASGRTPDATSPSGWRSLRAHRHVGSRPGPGGAAPRARGRGAGGRLPGRSGRRDPAPGRRLLHLGPERGDGPPVGGGGVAAAGPHPHAVGAGGRGRGLPPGPGPARAGRGGGLVRGPRHHRRPVVAPRRAGGPAAVGPGGHRQ